MIKNIFFLMFIFGMLSCSAPSLYQPEYSNLEGYSELKLTPTSYQVSFKGNEDTNIERAADLALLRAAQITQQQGFKYLSIISKNNNITRKNIRIPRTKATLVLHTMYKYKNVDMCRIEKNGTVEYARMSDLANQDMMREHKKYKDNSYSDIVYENYMDEYTTEKPKVIILIELINNTKDDVKNIHNANEIVEQITKKYQIKLNS